jgi:hypothetical protein
MSIDTPVTFDQIKAVSTEHADAFIYQFTYIIQYMHAVGIKWESLQRNLLVSHKTESFPISDTFVSCPLLIFIDFALP